MPEVGTYAMGIISYFKNSKKTHVSSLVDGRKYGIGEMY